jgi:hypothetical protein
MTAQWQHMQRQFHLPFPPFQKKITTDVSCAPVHGWLGWRRVCRFGRLDCCLNNAGVEGERALVQDYPTDMFDKVGDWSMLGPLLLQATRGKCGHVTF